MNESVLINYYAKLVKRGAMHIDAVPEGIRNLVIARVGELPPIPFDPETQTPEVK